MVSQTSYSIVVPTEREQKLEAFAGEEPKSLRISINGITVSLGKKERLSRKNVSYIGWLSGVPAYSR